MIKDCIMPVLLCAGLFLAGYMGGYRQAEDKGRADLAELRAAYERHHADALRELQDKRNAEARKAFLTDLALQKERNAHARKREEMREKIAAHNGAHVFGPEFIGLWNAAISAAPCPVLPGSDGPGLFDDAAGACARPVQGAGDGAGSAGESGGLRRAEQKP